MEELTGAAEERKMKVKKKKKKGGGKRPLRHTDTEKNGRGKPRESAGEAEVS